MTANKEKTTPAKATVVATTKDADKLAHAVTETVEKETVVPVEPSAQESEPMLQEPEAELSAVENEATVGAAYPQDLDTTAAIAVRVKSGGTMWRCGLKFGAEFTVLYRDSVSSADWHRIAAEPLLQVRSVTLHEAKS